MRRFGRIAAVSALAVLAAINVRVRAQSADDFAQTAAYAAAQQKVLVKASSEALSTLKKNDWNHYVLCAVGDRITLYLNGVASVVYCEEGPDIARDGLIAVQLHAGSPMEVQFKDIQIRVLP